MQQGGKAKKKSKRHGALSTGIGGVLREMLKSDEEHFRAVGTWWFVFSGGALAALAAELVDWFW